MINRKIKRYVKVGDVTIGGNSPISIQSMTNTDTRNIEATSRQIEALANVGCDIARLAIVDLEAAEAVCSLKKQSRIPLVADIHFDYRLALECIKNGIDKIRINPGNIGDRERVKKVVFAAKERQIPIRIGINAGSLEREILAKYGEPTPAAMVESAQKHIDILQEENFEDIVISVKASDVLKTIEAYKLISDKYDYPLHLGVTEAGTLYSGTIKNAVGIGTLLASGIGDTIRVSLTSDPTDEVIAGRKILSSLGLYDENFNLISCPTCGRCRVNVIEVASQLEKRLAEMGNKIKKGTNIAVMGCAVNGPGEAKEADIGIAGGNGEFLLFKKGIIAGKIQSDNAIETLIKELEKDND